MVTNYINGIEVELPENWIDLEIILSFEHYGVQPNIIIDNLVFVNESNRKIREFITGGGIFTKLPYSIEVGNLVIFNGYIDCKTVKYINTTKVEVKVAKNEGLNNIADKLDGSTFDNLTITQLTDIRYKVRREQDEYEEVYLNFVFAMLTIEIARLAKEISTQTANVVSIATGGAPIAGQASSLVLAITYLALNIVYAVILVDAYIKLLINIYSYYFPLKGTLKGISYYDGLTKICEYCGLVLDTDLELSDYIYIPSKQRPKLNITKGTPNINDYGFVLSEFVDLIKKGFNAKIMIANGKMYVYNQHSPFWDTISTYQMEDVLMEDYRLNTDNVFKTTVISYETDNTDYLTIDRWAGTNYEITNSVGADDTITGYNKINIPIVLGNAETGLNFLEELLADLFDTFRRLANTLNISINLPNISRNGTYLLIGARTFDKPKLCLKGVPADFKEKLSAKNIYWNWYRGGSLINQGKQRKIYEGVKIGFGISNLPNVINFGRIKNYAGQSCVLTKFIFKFAKDYAVIDIEEPFKYVELKENYNEPD